MAPSPNQVVETPQPVTPTPQPIAPAELPPPVLETPQQRYERLYNAQPLAPVSATQQVAPTPVAPSDPMAELRQEIAQLRNQLAQPASTSPPPAAEPVVQLTPWFEKLRQGDFEGAEADMISRVRNAVETEATRKSVTEALELMKVQMEINTYVNDLRGKNPDMVPMEPYLRAPVDARMEKANKDGKIHSSEDYLREYKAAVEAELTNLRTITAGIRAAATSAAQVRQQEVLASTPLNPQAVTHLPSEQPGTPDVETNEGYFARRAANAARLKGLG